MVAIFSFDHMTSETRELKTMAIGLFTDRTSIFFKIAIMARFGRGGGHIHANLSPEYTTVKPLLSPLY